MMDLYCWVMGGALVAIVVIVLLIRLFDQT